MADGSNNLAAASLHTGRIPRLLALDHRLVAIRGFLLPLKMNNGLAFKFLLMRNQNMYCFGSVPKVNEWIAVRTTNEGVKPVMDQPVTVLGSLGVGDLRENGYLVGIYQIEAQQVVSQAPDLQLLPPLTWPAGRSRSPERGRRVVSLRIGRPPDRLQAPPSWKATRWKPNCRIPNIDISEVLFV